jgi:hypothetical protein
MIGKDENEREQVREKENEEIYRISILEEELFRISLNGGADFLSA